MRTSINLNYQDISALTSAHEKCGLTVSQLLRDCLKKLFLSKNDRLLYSRISNLTEYQLRGVGYKAVTVKFEEREYNLCVNLRVFSRLSVSLIASMAINQFLENVVFEATNKNNSDNDVQNSYADYTILLRHNTETFVDKYTIEWSLYTKKETSSINYLPQKPH